MVLTVGERSKIHQRVSFSHSDDRPITIGDGANFYRGTEMLGPVTIGNNVFINRDAYIRPNTSIGDGACGSAPSFASSRILTKWAHLPAARASPDSIRS